MLDLEEVVRVIIVGIEEVISWEVVVVFPKEEVKTVPEVVAIFDEEVEMMVVEFK